MNTAIYGAKVTPLTVRRTLTTTYTAYYTLGQNDNRVGPWKRITGINRRVKSTDSSDATITAMLPTAGPFTNIVATDLIRFDGPKAVRTAPGTFVVATATDADNIEIDSAIDLDEVTGPDAQADGYEFRYRTSKAFASPAATVGWIPVGGHIAGNILLVPHSESSGSGGLDYKLEGRTIAGDVSTIVSGNLTQAQVAAATGLPIVLGEFNFETYGWVDLRLQLKASAGTVIVSAHVDLKQ